MRLAVLSALIMVMVCAQWGLAQPEEFVFKLGIEGAAGIYIAKVPDSSQPPEFSEPFRCFGFRSVDNWCAPLASANALVFLDQVAGVEWARGVSGGLSPDSLSAYLAFFMCTNGYGTCGIGSVRGTLTEIIPKGISKFVNTEGRRLPCPLEKVSYRWDAGFIEATRDQHAWAVYASQVERGIPAILCFSFWNPVKGERLEVVAESVNGSMIKIPLTFYLWGEPINSTEVLRKKDPKIPVEVWDEKAGIGHAVTGVGWLKGDPDGDGPMPDTLWAIVHDNWATTDEHVAIPWENLTALVLMGRE